MEKEKTMEEKIAELEKMSNQELKAIGKMLYLLLKEKELPAQENKGRWCGCCYESELDSFNGKFYE